MEEVRIIEGWLGLKDVDEAYGILHVGERRDLEDAEPLAELTEFMYSKTVTVRYWVCDEKCSKEEAAEDFLGTAMGYADAKYGAHYSELTGYLWTDEDLVVGGHDIIAELKTYIGQYLILEIEVHERQPRKRPC